MLWFCAAQFKFWFKTHLGRENSDSYYRQERQLLLTLLTTVTRSSRSTSNFYALIAPETVLWIRKIQVLSWKWAKSQTKAQKSSNDNFIQETWWPVQETGRLVSYPGDSQISRES